MDIYHFCSNLYNKIENDLGRMYSKNKYELDYIYEYDIKKMSYFFMVNLEYDYIIIKFMEDHMIIEKDDDLYKDYSILYRSNYIDFNYDNMLNSIVIKMEECFKSLENMNKGYI